MKNHSSLSIERAELVSVSSTFSQTYPKPRELLLNVKPSTLIYTVDLVGFVDWFKATQAMAIIGLIGLGVALLLVSLYMCVHTVSKNQTIIGLTCTCFLAGESSRDVIITSHH